MVTDPGSLTFTCKLSNDEDLLANTYNNYIFELPAPVPMVETNDYNATTDLNGDGVNTYGELLIYGLYEAGPGFETDRFVVIKSTKPAESTQTVEDYWAENYEDSIYDVSYDLDGDGFATADEIFEVLVFGATSETYTSIHYILK